MPRMNSPTPRARSKKNNPAKPKKKRNYAQEYARYHSRPEQIAKRSARNSARSTLMKEGKVKKGDGMDVHHVKPLAKGGSNARSNYKVVSASKNRSFKRNKNAGMA